MPRRQTVLKHGVSAPFGVLDKGANRSFTLTLVQRCNIFLYYIHPISTLPIYIGNIFCQRVVCIVFVTWRVTI